MHKPFSIKWIYLVERRSFDGVSMEEFPKKNCSISTYDKWNLKTQTSSIFHFDWVSAGRMVLGLFWTFLTFFDIYVIYEWYLKLVAPVVGVAWALLPGFLAPNNSSASVALSCWPRTSEVAEVLSNMEAAVSCKLGESS